MKTRFQLLSVILIIYRLTSNSDQQGSGVHAQLDELIISGDSLDYYSDENSQEELEIEDNNNDPQSDSTIIGDFSITDDEDEDEDENEDEDEDKVDDMDDSIQNAKRRPLIRNEGVRNKNLQPRTRYKNLLRTRNRNTGNDNDELSEGIADEFSNEFSQSVVDDYDDNNAPYSESDEFVPQNVKTSNFNRQAKQLIPKRKKRIRPKGFGHNNGFEYRIQNSFENQEQPCVPVWSEWTSFSPCRPNSCGACERQLLRRKCLTKLSCTCRGKSTKEAICSDKPCAEPRPPCCFNYEITLYKSNIYCKPSDNTISPTSIPNIGTERLIPTNLVEQQPTSTLQRYVREPCCADLRGTWSSWILASSKCSDSCGGYGRQARKRICLSTDHGCPCIYLGGKFQVQEENKTKAVLKTKFNKITFREKISDNFKFSGNSNEIIACNLRPCTFPRQACAPGLKIGNGNGEIPTICTPNIELFDKKSESFGSYNQRLFRGPEAPQIRDFSNFMADNDFKQYMMTEPEYYMSNIQNSNMKVFVDDENPSGIFQNTYEDIYNSHSSYDNNDILSYAQIIPQIFDETDSGENLEQQYDNALPKIRKLEGDDESGILTNETVEFYNNSTVNTSYAKNIISDVLVSNNELQTNESTPLDDEINNLQGKLIHEVELIENNNKTALFNNTNLKNSSFNIETVQDKMNDTFLIYDQLDNNILLPNETHQSKNNDTFLNSIDSFNRENYTEGDDELNLQRTIKSNASRSKRQIQIEQGSVQDFGSYQKNIFAGNYPYQSGNAALVGLHPGQVEWRENQAAALNAAGRIIPVSGTNLFSVPPGLNIPNVYSQIPLSNSLNYDDDSTIAAAQGSNAPVQARRTGNPQQQPVFLALPGQGRVFRDVLQRRVTTILPGLLVLRAPMNDDNANSVNRDGLVRIPFDALAPVQPSLSGSPSIIPNDVDPPPLQLQPETTNIQIPPNTEPIRKSPAQTLANGFPTIQPISTSEVLTQPKDFYTPKTDGRYVNPSDSEYAKIQISPEEYYETEPDKSTVLTEHEYEFVQYNQHQPTETTGSDITINNNELAHEFIDENNLENQQTDDDAFQLQIAEVSNEEYQQTRIKRQDNVMNLRNRIHQLVQTIRTQLSNRLQQNNTSKNNNNQQSGNVPQRLIPEGTIQQPGVQRNLNLPTNSLGDVNGGIRVNSGPIATNNLEMQINRFNNFPFGRGTFQTPNFPSNIRQLNAIRTQLPESLNAIRLASNTFENVGTIPTNTQPRRDLTPSQSTQNGNGNFVVPPITDDETVRLPFSNTPNVVNPQSPISNPLPSFLSNIQNQRLLNIGQQVPPGLATILTPQQPQNQNPFTNFPSGPLNLPSSSFNGNLPIFGQTGNTPINPFGIPQLNALQPQSQSPQSRSGSQTISGIPNLTPAQLLQIQTALALSNGLSTNSESNAPNIFIINRSPQDILATTPEPRSPLRLVQIQPGIFQVDDGSRISNPQTDTSINNLFRVSQNSIGKQPYISNSASFQQRQSQPFVANRGFENNSPSKLQQRRPLPEARQEMRQPNCCVPGGIWDLWTEWSLCDNDCGACGVRKRTRLCASQFNGCPCSNAATLSSEIQRCNPTPCAFPNSACCGNLRPKRTESYFICA